MATICIVRYGVEAFTCRAMACRLAIVPVAERLLSIKFDHRDSLAEALHA